MDARNSFRPASPSLARTRAVVASRCDTAQLPHMVVNFVATRCRVLPDAPHLGHLGWGRLAFVWWPMGYFSFFDFLVTMRAPGSGIFSFLK